MGQGAAELTAALSVAALSKPQALMDDSVLVGGPPDRPSGIGN